MKSDWTRSVWAKAGAFLLAVALVPVMFIYGMVFAFSYAGELDGDFYDGSLCVGAVYEELRPVYHYWEVITGEETSRADGDAREYYGIADRAELLEKFAAWYPADSEYNVRFAIVEDETGEVLFDNHRAGDIEVENWCGSVNGASYRTFVTPELTMRDSVYWAREIYGTIERLAPNALAVALVSAAVEIVLLVYLACVSARRRGVSEPVAGWQEKIPFDLYIAVGGFACVLLILAAGSAVDDSWGYDPVFIAVVIGSITLAWAFVLGFWMTLCARVKLGRWWENTVIFWLLHRCVRAVKWCWKCVRGAWRACLGFCRALPLVWRTAVGGLVLSLLTLVMGPAASLVMLLLTVAACLFSMQLRRLQRGGEAHAAGDLTARVDTSRMYFDLRRHGENLNAISHGMTIAVEQQLKSERLKTELITNVSHDIKTPLTSIINYVDLLQREHTGEQEREYLAVLDRQAHKLKKLTVDLVEMSKASTGNLPCTISGRSVSELLAQAVGEYAERLSLAQLEPVVTVPDAELCCLCDGSLMWRVLDNLLSNACKYAQSGTRLYLGAQRAGERVEFTCKNISRDALNIAPDELLERFVRGDSSRTSEGSGLGLNIAKSLVELQQGTFSLAIDGDLFKVTFTLPAA